jgi:glycosyltransferase involved in cell wall biosynthesis
MRNKVNLGAARNYNCLLELSSGRYFRWAAADDLLGPTSLEQCLAVLETNHDVVLCYPKTSLIDENGETIAPYDDHLDLRSTNPCDRYRLALQIGRNNAIYGLIRADVLRTMSPMGSYPGADVDFLIGLCLYGRFFEIPEGLFFRRMHADAYSSIKTLQGMQTFFDPKTRGRIHLSHWKRLFVRLAAVWRAPLKTTTRLHLSYILARGAVTARRELLKELVLGFRETTRRSWFANQRIGQI